MYSHAVVVLHHHDSDNYQVEIILCRNTSEVFSVKEMVEKHPADTKRCHQTVRVAIIDGESITAHPLDPKTRFHMKTFDFDDYRRKWLKTELSKRVFQGK